MVQALRLTVSGSLVSTLEQNVSRTLIYRSFPVRIGRDASNHCVLGALFVSREHARIELERGKLVLYDDGSKCGTFVRLQTERVQGGVELVEVGGEFQIGTIMFRAELVDADEVQTADVERVLSNAREILDRHREQLGGEVLGLLSGLEAPARARALCALVRRFPEVREVPGLAALISSIGVTQATSALDAIPAALMERVNSAAAQ